jgi:uncharacterized protein YecT (DUF1311 family)/WD40 repeat protein
MLTFVVQIASVVAQVPSHEQLQLADAQLNQVYQQLRGALSAEQKQQLKTAQREWIKKRDAYVAANPGNPQWALYQATMERVNILNSVLTKMATSEAKLDAASKGKSTNVNSPNADHVFPIPQVNKSKWIFCASTSEDRSLIAVGQPQVVTIWTKNFEALLRSIPCNADTLRILPDNKTLLVIGKPLDPENSVTATEMNAALPVATYYSIEDGSKLASYTLASSKGVDSPYITKDGKHVILSDNGTLSKEGVDFWIFDVPTSVFKNTDKREGELQKNFVGPLEEAIKLYPEIRSAIERINGSERIDNEKQIAAVLADLNKNSHQAYFASKELLEKRLQRQADEVLRKNYAISTNGSNLALLGRGLVRIIDLQSGVANEINIPDNAYVLSASFSPDGKKLAIICSNTDEIQAEKKSIVYKGLILDLLNANIISVKSIANTVFPECGLGKPVLRWMGNNIYLSDGAIFDGSFNQIEEIKGLHFPVTSSGPPVLLKANESGEKQPNGRNKIESVSLIDPSSLTKVGELKYDSRDSDPTCPELPPFDINEKHDALLKSWKYWRGGGGLYYLNNSREELFSGILPDRMPVFSAFLPDGNILYAGLTDDGSELEISIINPKESPKILASIKTSPLSSIQLSPDFKALYGIQANGFLVKYAICGNNITPLGQYLSNSKDSLIITSDYLYLSHGNPNSLLRFTRGVHSYPLEQFDLRLNRPDIVLDLLGAPKEAIEAAKSLREKRLKRMVVTEEMLKPDFHLPELQIVGDVPASTPKDQLNLQIKASDDKFPLDRLRVYLNNVPVNGRDGELLRDQKTQSLERTIPIKLASGRNKIQVSVLNSAGAESLYANAEVNCTAVRPKPKLYAVALGVSQYDRPEWCLKYAAKDATDLIEKLKVKSGSDYSEVKPLLLTDKDVTKESVARIKEFLSGATIDDTVLIFMAGHGILDDKYDYYFGTSDIDPAKPSERGMPYEAIDNILAEVPSLKKALLMDTCHAGELDDDEKKELAASDGKSAPVATDSSLKGKVAMRSIGTRGMNVKAIEGAKGKSDWYEKLQDMFVDLRRGSGATIISSSQGAEYAYESSEQSNGLFTYALMEALDGKATPNKDGQITISTVGDYVKKRVQDLTKSKQNPNLRGVNLEEDFTVSAIK